MYNNVLILSELLKQFLLMIKQTNKQTNSVQQSGVSAILASVYFVFEWLGEASFCCFSWGREVVLLLICTEHSLDSAVIVCDDEGT